MKTADLREILIRLDQDRGAGKQEIKTLLSLSDPDHIDQLFEAARRVRSRIFGKGVFLYGFLYFSTHCRNDCWFCQYRQSNKQLPRYRKTRAEILAAAREMSAAGVHLIDLTMGEDPKLYADKGAGFDGFISMIQAVRKETGLPVMVSPGAVPDTVIKQLAKSGVTWYACYQETHTPPLFNFLRQGQCFEQRLAKKHLAHDLGMLVEEGLLTGVGETLDDLAHSIVWMKNFSVDQARVMTFIPQAGTPMAAAFPQDNLKERMIIAVMRLVLHDRLIPASLDVDGLEGLKARLDAGANVVTSIVPPQKGLAGVANHSLDIEDSRRTLDHILPVLETCGLSPASLEEYRSWIFARQKGL
jgi:methylornithine synthase